MGNNNAVKVTENWKFCQHLYVATKLSFFWENNHIQFKFFCSNLIDPLLYVFQTFMYISKSKVCKQLNSQETNILFKKKSTFSVFSIMFVLLYPFAC